MLVLRVHLFKLWKVHADGFSVTPYAYNCFLLTSYQYKMLENTERGWGWVGLCYLQSFYLSDGNIFTSRTQSNDYDPMMKPTWVFKKDMAFPDQNYELNIKTPHPLCLLITMFISHSLKNPKQHGHLLSHVRFLKHFRNFYVYSQIQSQGIILIGIQQHSTTSSLSLYVIALSITLVKKLDFS